MALNKFILDTHALIWYLEGNPKLGHHAKVVINDPSSEMVLPLIALAEAVDIVSKGRTSLPNVVDLLDDVRNEPRIEIVPLTLDILEQSLLATLVPEMHDRLITATGLHLQTLGYTVSILTKDPHIVSSGLLTVVW